MYTYWWLLLIPVFLIFYVDDLKTSRILRAEIIPIIRTSPIFFPQCAHCILGYLKVFESLFLSLIYSLYIIKEIHTKDGIYTINFVNLLTPIRVEQGACREILWWKQAYSEFITAFPCKYLQGKSLKDFLWEIL